MKTRNAEHTAFVASLMYGSELWPMSIEEARYTMEQWKEEGSVEIPEGFTPEIYAEIWNDLCPADDDKDDYTPKYEIEFTTTEGGSFTVEVYDTAEATAEEAISAVLLIHQRGGNTMTAIRKLY